MGFLKNIKLSGLAIFIVALSCFIIDFSFKNWERSGRVIENEARSYYSYLPARFIYDDLPLEQSDYHFEDGFDLFNPVYTAGGKKVIGRAMGLSFLYAPFFFAAHAYAIVTDYPENGFSEPYKFFLLLSAVFYLVIGLDFVRRILNHYKFSDLHIAITLLLTGLGTNLLCYSSQSAPMPPVYSFCLFAAFAYFTIRWYEAHTMKHTIILGLLLGLISLIKPSDCVILVFFFLYGVSGWEEFKQRLAFFRRECFLLNVVILFAFLTWIPQFIYWDDLTGYYFFSSSPGEQFFFTQPQLAEGLFSFRKGWLLYTPLMTFPLLGFFIKDPRLKKYRWAIIIFFVVNIYIVFSWWCWWNGPSYGQSSLIASYAILAIPLALFVQSALEKKWLMRSAFLAFSVFFIWLNIFQTFQYENTSLHPEGMTKELYLKQFGRYGKISNYNQYLDFADADEAKKGNFVVVKSNIKEMSRLNGKIESGRKTVQLIAYNNKYVCADETRGDMMYANKDVPYTWETFSLLMFENGHCGILSYKNKFLCTELNNNREITATRDKCGDWETFTILSLGNDNVAFKAVNGSYISVDERGQLFANSLSVGEKETFKLIQK
jgi:hypothetical protein